MNPWGKVRALLADPERAERRRQRKIRSAMIGQTMARGEGGHAADTAIRDNQSGVGGTAG
jgi:hypothetical protein